MSEEIENNLGEDINESINQRLQPIGSSSSPESSHTSLNDIKEQQPDYECLKRENETLNLSLLSLTSHLAQVQFRLDQILDSNAENKEELLGSLKEFTSEGVPDLNLELNEEQVSSNVISRLRKQLDNIETYAFYKGKLDSIPTSMKIKRQQLIIEKLKGKLNLHINDLNSNNLSEEDLKNTIELAVDEIITPLKDNVKLVEQLKTQINDLERFIEFLNGSGKNVELLAQALKLLRQKEALLNSESWLKVAHNDEDDEILDVREIEDDDIQWSQEFLKHAHIGSSRSRRNDKVESGRIKIKDSTLELVKKGIVILQLFAMSQLPNSKFSTKPMGKSENPEPQPIRKTKNSAKVELAKNQHWGIARAQLEIAISQVIEKANELKRKDHHMRRQESQTLPSISENSSVISSKESIEDQSIISIPLQINEKLSNGQHSPNGQGINGIFEVEDVNTYPNSENDSIYINETEKELVSIVRKQFCPALRNLIEHGLIKNSSMTSIGGDSAGDGHNERKLVVSGTFLGCLPILSSKGHQKSNNMKKKRKSSKLLNSLNEDSNASCSDEEGEDSDSSTVLDNESNRNKVHAWKLFMLYYDLKNGSSYNDSPARKLSQSYNLDVVGGKTITSKQFFLSSLGSVIQIHETFKRSDESKFKAIISIALNERKLVSWLKMIFKNRIILDSLYHPWSYAVSTRFYDSLESLSKLSEIDFNLPIDLNVRHLTNIKDAF